VVENMKKRLSIVCVLAASLTVAMSGVARADTTLGSLAIPSGSTPGVCDAAVIAQVASDASTPYTVPSPGTITSWRVNGLASPDAPISLVVLKDTGGGSFTVVGVDTHSTPNPVPDVISFTVISPIAVSGSEILGLYDASTNLACYWHDGDTPLTDALIALGNPTTPTANQVLNLDDSSGGGFTLNLEATLTPPASTPPPPATHKKKCKKHKRKHSASSAKKKHCKKKKKK
jgi:hypothetical protein